MKNITREISRFILAILIILFSFTSGDSAEIDDSVVFIEAFNAYQQKDYLLTIEKCTQLNQAFPDSPLRDVTILFIARASLKSGDNERAAKSATMFLTEFPESALKSSVEDELKVLAQRHQKGELITADKSLQMAASKVRMDVMARERAAKLKLDMEIAAKAKADRERLARIKLEEDRRERDRLQAEKIAKASINATITLPDGFGPFPAGTVGRQPFEIYNNGKNSEGFLLTTTVAKDYNAILIKADKPDKNITQLQLAAGEKFKGFIVFTMPAKMVDGHRSPFTVKAVSTRFSDVSFQKESLLLSSAPLVRVVAKLAKQKVSPGEKLNYRVTVLNVGSSPANNVTVALHLPPQVEFLGAPGVIFNHEPNGSLVFKMDLVEIGKLAEINLDVKISESCVNSQELRGRVEIVNSTLQRKEIFTTGTSVVVAAK